MAEALAPLLPDDASAARVARQRLRVAGSLWAPMTLDVAMLLTSELVTNAVRHGSGPIRLEIADSSARVLIAIYDTSDDRPGPSMELPSDTAESGRGIPLLAALSQEWGIDDLPEGSGKSTWFTLSHNGST